MKNQLLTLSALLLLATGCKKDDDTTTTPANPNPAQPASASFKWKEDGGSEITADSAFWTTYTGGTGIRAYKGGMTNFFEINFKYSTVGTQTLSQGGLTFLKGNATYTNPGQGADSVVITSNTADSLTGTGVATLTGGTIQKLTWTFTKLKKR